MAGLKIDNLSDSLLEYLEGLGLSEEQVQQLIDNISGDLSALQTTDKSSLVAAINELFQNANNGKELIATAIGEPLNSNDTFNAMSNDIKGLLSTFKTNMMNAGVVIGSGDKFKQLIDKLATLVDSEGKGIQYDSRTVTPSEIKTGSFDQYSLGSLFNNNNVYYLTISDLKFTPSVIIITGSHIYRNETKMTYGVFDIMNNMPYYVICSGGDANLADAQTLSNTIKSAFCYNMSVSNSMNFPLGFAVNTSYSATLNNFTWHAFGVGEEDTTLRDSLASILQDEGVSVTPEDEDMANLITKTDEEFDRKNNKAEDIRSTLAGLMKDGGYEITGNEDIDILLELLRISGISLDEIKQISCGNDHTFVLKTDGSLWSCGYNSSGQLGLGLNVDIYAFTQVNTNINNDVKEVICGHYHTFILKNDGTVWSCGNNVNGQLGLGDVTNRNIFTKVNIDNVKQISCGYSYTLILKTDGSVWSCGYNNYGQLGFGDTDNRYVFTKVTTNINNDVKQISCGENNTFILKTDGSIWSCGYNLNGELGLGYTNAMHVFTKVTTNINNDVKQIVGGYSHTFILKNDGSIWACGLNNYGKLGIGDSGNKYTTFTQVTTNINNDVKQIACGYESTFILKNDGSVWSCGYNGFGQLGLGDTTKRTTFTQVTSNINNDVKQVDCGFYHIFILKNDGTVWSCGRNNNGQLGLGTIDTNAHSAFTQIPKGLY